MHADSDEKLEIMFHWSNHDSDKIIFAYYTNNILLLLYNSTVKLPYKQITYLSLSNVKSEARACLCM